MHNRAPVLENDTHKLLWYFDVQTDHLISARRPHLMIINKKKLICKIVYFAVPTDHRIKLREYEKDKFLDLARELKKLWNMKVTIIPIVIGIIRTVTKGSLKELEDLEVGRRVETIQTTTLLRTARILRKLLETWKTCCHSNSSNRSSANADVKNSKGVSNNQNSIIHTTGWGRWFTGYFTKKSNLTIPTSAKIRPREWHTQISLGFWDKNGSSKKLNWGLCRHGRP